MEIPWPQAGDKAFQEGPRACYMGTQRDGPNELGMIADGYKKASDILVQHLGQHGRNDALVYPILFGYRQYLELRIKALVVIVNRCEYLEDTYKWIHELDKLWNPIRSRLWESLRFDDQVPFQIVECVIEEFQSLDPKSYGFRFPSAIEQFNVDLLSMREVMGRVATFLDSLSDWWHAGLDAMPGAHDLA
jgi:hypothetical protein